MAERKPAPKGKKRAPSKARTPRPPKHNVVHVAVWSMNGEPVPKETLDEIELSVTMQALASPVRLLTSVTRT